MSEKFVHLHVHSEYSLLDSAARIRDLVATAREQGMSALALTDHNVMFGALAFYKACKAAGIKPIIGLQLDHRPFSVDDVNRTFSITLLARSTAGYHNLLRLSTMAQTADRVAHVTKEQLAAHTEGLICLAGDMDSELAYLLLEGRQEAAQQWLSSAVALFADGCCYAELQDHRLLDQKKVVAELIPLAQRLGLPLVASNDVHYLMPEQVQAHHILRCIAAGTTTRDARAPITDQRYFKSADEMVQSFAALPEALGNTIRIAEQCSVELDLDRVLLPAYGPLPDGVSSGEYLRAQCEQGLQERFAGSAEWATQSSLRSEAVNRLSYELSVIDRMGFNDYFLIVWDFIRYAHQIGVRVGPGRGSAAGSLVAYTLHITDVDPLKHKLLFERFLNPARVSMPDIDIDFDDERRDEVIAYVARKYGTERVAQIVTFGTMAARAALRDVGRVLSLRQSDIDRACKLVPALPGTSLAEARAKNRELQEWSGSRQEIQHLFELAAQVEGLPRHTSTHAAGIIIAGAPLVEIVPLQAGSGDVPLTQYAMDDLATIGLLKMDFLGLRTLSIIERTLAWIHEIYGTTVDFSAIPMNDPQTFALLTRGDTTGIFQLESAGVRKVLKELKPNSFEDIVSVLALYRPGPMEFIPKFIEGKHGHSIIDYPHPTLEHILSDTYGIIVYQEQIMQIASTMAGFSLGEADLLRRAVSKKKREVLDEQRIHFVQGSIAQGHSDRDANRVYDMIVRFADYGFNRAHAVAYAVLAFQTAYLKAHYPVAFMASMMASTIGNAGKTAQYVDDCRKLGVHVLPPNINESGVSFQPLRTSIRFGLTAVRNVGPTAIAALLEERHAQGPFRSLLDLCRRVDLNKRVLESLILAGACDGLGGGHRNQLFVALDETHDSATRWRKEKNSLQLDLLDLGIEEVIQWDVPLPDVPEWSRRDRIEYEREYIGLYLTDHPLNDYEQNLAKLPGVHPNLFDRLSELDHVPDEGQALITAMVVMTKPFTTKKGKPMAFLELEDAVMRCEAVAFTSTWEKAKTVLQPGQLIVALVSVQHQEEGYKLVVQDVALLDDQALDNAAFVPTLLRMKLRSAPERRSERQSLPKQTLYVQITAANDNEQVIRWMKDQLARSPGSTEVIVHYEQSRTTVKLTQPKAVHPTAELLFILRDKLGPNNVVLK